MRIVLSNQHACHSCCYEWCNSTMMSRHNLPLWIWGRIDINKSPLACVTDWLFTVSAVNLHLNKNVTPLLYFYNILITLCTYYLNNTPQSNPLQQLCSLDVHLHTAAAVINQADCAFPTCGDFWSSPGRTACSVDSEPGAGISARCS